MWLLLLVLSTLKFPQDVIRTNTLLTMNTLDWISRSYQKTIVFINLVKVTAASDLFNTEIPTAENHCVLET